MNYKERVEKFLQLLQPAIEAEERFYKELPVGSQFWIPCSGIQSKKYGLNIPSGHTGRIETYLGDKKWSNGNWVSIDEAQDRDMRISSSHGICPSCSKIIDELS